MRSLMRWLWERLFLRLQIFMATIGVLCLVLVGLTLHAQRIERELVESTSEIAQKQALVERANGLVYAVVMESRGLYMADTPAKIERFGKGLEAQLEALRKTRDGWRALVRADDAADFALFDKNCDEFIRLRTELVREARAKGAEGARAVGDNDANRAVRTAFNDSLDALSQTYKRRAAEVVQSNDLRHFWTALVANGFLLLVAAMTLGGWAWTARYMSTPFSSISDNLRRINAGETDFAVAHQDRVDEVGVIARAIDSFRQQLIQRAEIERGRSQDITRKAERQARFEQAIASFETAATGRVASVSQTANELHHASEALSTSAALAARQVAVVTEHSGEMNTSIESLSQVGEQLVHAIGEIAQGMGRANAVSERASSLSAETTTKFTDLEQAVSAIGHVVELINQIAGQTNLLALNATIEAARAGEAGRGFAVVAAEVKQLAAQTTQATAEITANVSNVQAVTGESIAAVESIGAIIEDMRRIAVEVSGAVEEQRAATSVITQNVRAAASGTQAVSDNISGVEQAAEETGAASVQVLTAARKLAEESSGIKNEVERFLGAIRAA